MEALGTDTNCLPCCICIKKNKICSKNCEFAAYFPNKLYFSYIFLSLLILDGYYNHNINFSLKYLLYRNDDYESADDLFGTQNIIRMMKLALQDQKPMLAFSILEEGVAWANDKIGGGFAVIQKLLWKIKSHEACLSHLRKMISEEKKQLVLLLNK